jgi:hypothetical protein
MAVFPRRQNKDGSVDVICPRCFRTVASGQDEVRLRHDEKLHVCAAGDLLGLETGKAYERSRNVTPRRKA